MTSIPMHVSMLICYRKATGERQKRILVLDQPKDASKQDKTAFASWILQQAKAKDRNANTRSHEHYRRAQQYYCSEVFLGLAPKQAVQ